MSLTHKKNYARISKYKKNQYFEKFIMSFPILKKLQKDENLFVKWSFLLESMRKDDNSEIIALNEAVNFVNSNLSLENHISLWELQQLIKKNVLKAKTIEKGLDSKGRQKRRYEISKTELENYIGIMQMFEASEHFDLIKKEKHPQTGEQIIVFYETLTQSKKGVSPTEVKMDLMFRLLQKVEFQTFLQSLLKNNINSV